MEPACGVVVGVPSMQCPLKPCPCLLHAQVEYAGVVNLALRVRCDLSGCLSTGACAFSLWITAMLACPSLA